MSEENFVNPFSDFGNIVYGERFINRRDSIRAVENRVIRPREPGNLAIIGDYRIGNLSLELHNLNAGNEQGGKSNSCRKKAL